jgi:hypothetical protein
MTPCSTGFIRLNLKSKIRIFASPKYSLSVPIVKLLFCGVVLLLII